MFWGLNCTTPFLQRQVLLTSIDESLRVVFSKSRTVSEVDRYPGPLESRVEGLQAKERGKCFGSGGEKE